MGGGAVGGESSSLDLEVRSVAVDASGRLGNVASDIIEDLEVCRGCGVHT